MSNSEPADKNSLGHYILETRESAHAAQLKRDGTYAVRYDGIGLFFCPAAGAEAPFAVGRINLTSGEVNPITYYYYATLPYAEFNYRFGQS